MVNGGRTLNKSQVGVGGLVEGRGRGTCPVWFGAQDGCVNPVGGPPDKGGGNGGLVAIRELQYQ